MLVYDITNAKSFENISKWLRNIDEVKPKRPYHHVVVCDLSKIFTRFYKTFGKLSVCTPFSFVLSLA